MFKKLTTVSAFMVSAFTFSQVGIETDTPQATLDVVGKPADNSVLDGIIAPRLEGAQLRAKTYTSAQIGALVYVTLADTAPAGQTIDVTAAGYYYFNGLKWVLAGVGNMVNIYTASGALTSNRTLTLSGFPLNFTGAQQRTNWNANGLLTVNNLQTTGGEASVGFIGGNNSNFYIQQFRGGTVQMIANGNNNRLFIGTSYTTPPSDIRFDTSLGGGVIGEPRMYITSIGNVKIGANDVATEKLDVDGIARVRVLPANGATNAIFTTPGGSASTTQNQTFTATRTVVADDNGVLGYVTGLPAAPVNIYTANGSLTSNRTLTFNTRTMEFVGSANKTTWASSGAMKIQGLNSTVSARPTFELIAPSSNGTTSANLWMYVNPSSTAGITAIGDVTALVISTGGNITGVSKPIRFETMDAGGTNRSPLTLTGEGRVGVQMQTPAASLHVVKNSADLTPAIIAGCPTYADNAAASAAGLPVGGLYRKADGTLMVRF